MKGQDRLDIDDTHPRWTLDLLPEKFSGIQLVSMMQTRLKQIAPNMDTGIDMAAKHAAAQAMTN